jgi:hypothetical protein
MIRSFGDETIIKNWLRNRNTVEFLGIWEQIYNPTYNPVEFDRIISETGLNYFVLSVKKWTEATNAIGIFAKINYRIHTDAIKQMIIPAQVTSDQASVIYASEADLLNVALFEQTAQQWRINNPEKEGNIRDDTTLEQLVVLSNLESLNSVFIYQEIPQSE